MHCIIACTIPIYYVTCNYEYNVTAASTNKNLSHENNNKKNGIWIISQVMIYGEFSI